MGLVPASGGFQVGEQISQETFQWGCVMWGEGVFSVGLLGKVAFEQGHKRCGEAILGNSAGARGGWAL